jgi:ABC-type molybdate transport system ATPase subunit
MLAISRALMANPDLILLDELQPGPPQTHQRDAFEIVVRITASAAPPSCWWSKKRQHGALNASRLRL